MEVITTFLVGSLVMVIMGLGSLLVNKDFEQFCRDTYKKDCFNYSEVDLKHRRYITIGDQTFWFEPKDTRQQVVRTKDGYKLILNPNIRDYQEHVFKTK